MPPLGSRKWLLRAGKKIFHSQILNCHDFCFQQAILTLQCGGHPQLAVHLRHLNRQDPRHQSGCHQLLAETEAVGTYELLNRTYLPDSNIHILSRTASSLVIIYCSISIRIVSKQRRQNGRFEPHTGFSCTGPGCFD